MPSIQRKASRLPGGGAVSRGLVPALVSVVLTFAATRASSPKARYTSRQPMQQKSWPASATGGFGRGRPQSVQGIGMAPKKKRPHRCGRFGLPDRLMPGPARPWGEGNKPCRPQNLANDETNKKCLGLRFKFIYPGKNVVALMPPASRKIYRTLDELDHNNKPKIQETPGIKLPGKVKALSVWVLGRGNDYTLEAWVQDWKGTTHVLKMGSVNFVGWRPLSAKVPVGVPQDIDTYPQTKNLVLTKLVLRSKPTANTEKVVIFFDSIKVLSDVYDVHFDGADVDFDENDKKEKAEAKEYAKNLKKYTEGGK